jgi:3-oxoacyl-[acyl-carrier protein] reductase
LGFIKKILQIDDRGDARFPLRGKLAVVTGASGAIGSEVARRLARDGASVIVHFNSNRDDAESVAREIDATGGSAEAIGANLAHGDGPATLIRGLDVSFGGRFSGRLDVLVNNAGILEVGPLADTTDESFDRLFNVNVRACFQLSREAAKRMTKTGWGRIINMGSVFGESAPAAGLGIYCGTKFALRGLTRAWSRDLGPAGITVNNIQPALIQEEPYPTAGPVHDALERFVSVGRFGKPADIAEAVAFLANPKAGYINGESLTVDGGWSA